VSGNYETTEADMSSTEQQASGIKRTDLQQHDLSIPGREVVQNRVDISPEAPAFKHLHPGEEIIYGFGLYRALDATIAQNQQRKTTPLTMPVLAIGGAESWGEEAGEGMKPAADDVQTVVIPDTGHWVAEQGPEEMLAALTEFLAPYREDGGGLR
jgi:pimeloyl-ACP methyl ester carboxylesterase